jgi:hypothetical protein
MRRSRDASRRAASNQRPFVGIIFPLKGESTFSAQSSSVSLQRAFASPAAVVVRKNSAQRSLAEFGATPNRIVRRVVVNKINCDERPPRTPCGSMAQSRFRIVVTLMRVATEVAIHVVAGVRPTPVPRPGTPDGSDIAPVLCCGGTEFATATAVVAEPILEVHTRAPS